MSQIVTAVFDGQVLRPDTPLDLELGKRYVIRISTESERTGDLEDALKAYIRIAEATKHQLESMKREGKCSKET